MIKVKTFDDIINPTNAKLNCKNDENIIYKESSFTYLMVSTKQNNIPNLRFVIAESNFFPGDIFFFVLEFLKAKNMFIGKKL